jgi:choline monooxygenase
VQHAWNYMDKFHISFIHKALGGLADAIELSSYQTELYPYSALQWAYAKRPEDGFSPEKLPLRLRDPHDPRKRVFALWWFLFPNLTLNFYPWGLSVNLYSPIARQPEKTRFFWYHYVFDENRYSELEQVWLNTQVDEEDVDAMAQVRRNIASHQTPRGRFAPEEEKGPHWFHRLVYRSIFEKS